MYGVRICTYTEIGNIWCYLVWNATRYWVHNPELATLFKTREEAEEVAKLYWDKNAEVYLAY